jgi:hypothetical protein
MTYAIKFVAKTKRDAKRQVNAEMAKAATAQPCHSRDILSVVHAAHSFIECISIPRDSTDLISVSITGHLRGEFVDGDVEHPSGLSFTIDVDRVPNQN